MNRWHLIRDILFVGAGLIIAYHEEFVRAHSDPQLLILAGALLGLPAFFRADR